MDKLCTGAGLLPSTANDINIGFIMTRQANAPGFWTTAQSLYQAQRTSYVATGWLAPAIKFAQCAAKEGC